MIPEITEIIILHCCLERGVKLQVKTRSPITADHVRDIQTELPRIQNVTLLEASGGGFFRCSLPGGAVISGVLGSDYFHVMYTFFSRISAMRELEAAFPGFVEEFEVAHA